MLTFLVENKYCTFLYWKQRFRKSQTKSAIQFLPEGTALKSALVVVLMMLIRGARFIKCWAVSVAGDEFIKKNILMQLSSILTTKHAFNYQPSKMKSREWDVFSLKHPLSVLFESYV